MHNQNTGIPTFTPPKAGTPTFTPPIGNRNSSTGPGCHYHSDEPAVATCTRCNKNLCDECLEAYGVSIGDYANQAPLL